MWKSFYKLLLALYGYKLLGFKNNIIVGISTHTGIYVFWTIDSVSKRLILFDTCLSRDEAEFKYNIVLK